MSKIHLLLLCAIPMFALSVLTGVIAQDDKAESKPKPAKQDLRQSLLGAWVLLGEPGTKEGPKDGARMKFWGRGHWLITHADPQSGKVIFHHGGTYTLDGDKYEETITFATEPTKDLIGETFRFKIAVKGDRYTQIGDGNPFTEEWQRLTK